MPLASARVEVASPYWSAMSLSVSPVGDPVVAGRGRAARARRDVEPVPRVDDVGVGEVVRTRDVRGVDPEGRRRCRSASRLGGPGGDDLPRPRLRPDPRRRAGGRPHLRPAQRPRQVGVLWWSGARGWWDLPRGLRPQGRSTVQESHRQHQAQPSHQQQHAQEEVEAPPRSSRACARLRSPPGEAARPMPPGSAKPDRAASASERPRSDQIQRQRAPEVGGTWRFDSARRSPSRRSRLASGVWSTKRIISATTLWPASSAMRRCISWATVR